VKPTKPRFTSWSPSRLFDYDQCPFFAKLKHIDKLCPTCFKGKVRGGFDKPEICDTCGHVKKVPAPLARGSAIGLNLELFVNNEETELHEEIRHPTIIALAKELRKEHGKGRVKTELGIILDNRWNILKGDFPAGAWLRTKLDVFRNVTARVARVIDWKTGGIDKTTGNVKDEQDKYEDQLGIYSLVTLLAFPTVDYVESALAFVDTGPRFNPVIEMKQCNLDRKDLEKAKKKWENRSKPMLSDTTFAPRANGTCTYCPFKKGKGGPCRF
jgi:hypothetical protein